MESTIELGDSPTRLRQFDLSSTPGDRVLTPSNLSLEDSPHSTVVLSTEKVRNPIPLKTQLRFARPRPSPNHRRERLTFVSEFQRSSLDVENSPTNLLGSKESSPTNSPFGYKPPGKHTAKTRSLFCNYQENSNSLAIKSEETDNTHGGKSFSLFLPDGDMGSSSHLEKKLGNLIHHSASNTPSNQAKEESPSIRVNFSETVATEGTITLKCNNERRSMPSLNVIPLDPTATLVFFTRNPDSGAWDYSHFDPVEADGKVNKKDVERFFKAVEKATQKHFDESFSITSFLKAFCFGVPALAMIIVGMILVMLEWSHFGTTWTSQLTVGVTLAIVGGVMMVLAAFCGYSAYEVRKARRKYKKALEDVVCQQNREMAYKQIEWKVDYDSDIIELRFD